MTCKAYLLPLRERESLRDGHKRKALLIVYVYNEYVFIEKRKHAREKRRQYLSTMNVCMRLNMHVHNVYHGRSMP